MIEKEYGKHTEHNHNFYCKTILPKNYFTETNCVNCLLPISTFLVLPGKFALDLLTNCFTDGDRDLVIGTDNGVYLVNQWPIDEDIGPQLIIDTVDVTQIDILEEHRLFMILSNGTLSSYPIEVLNASGDQDLLSCEPQKVQDYVDFFKIGISVGRHLVCSVNTSESSTEIRVFQPTDIFNQNGMRLALDSRRRGVVVASRGSPHYWELFLEKVLPLGGREFDSHHWHIIPPCGLFPRNLACYGTREHLGAPKKRSK